MTAAAFDITPYLDVAAAPTAVFRRARDSRDQVRFVVHDGGERLEVTWGEFADSIAQVSDALVALGVRPGDHAAVFADNSVRWAAAALAIQAAGAIMVPIYGSSTAEQAHYILSHSEAVAVFVDSPERVQRVNGAALRHVIAMTADAEAHDSAPLAWPPGCHPIDWRPAEARLAAIDLDAPGLMLYTSGSTGRPKGVPLSHNNVGKNSRGWLECNRRDLHERAVDVLWLPMSHIFGFGELCLGNTLGFTSHLVTPKRALEVLPEIRPTVFMSVPAYWEKLASRARDIGGDGDAAAAALRDITGGRLRFCLSGGAGLKREVKELFYRAGVLIIEGYGLTECSPTLTLNSRDAFRFDTVGKPLSNVELMLADDGEILARGPSVFGGYHRDDDATAAAFTDDGWFCTGDLGRLTDDGFLQIIGRKKEILVTAGGKNVPPANIELRFADEPAIEHVVVYGDGKKYLVAGVWLTDGVAATEADIQRAVDTVNADLPSYETIKRFRIMDTPLTVESGTLTASLKLRRNHVYRAFERDFEALYD